MCYSIQEIYTCGHTRAHLERCPLEFQKGHTLGYAMWDSHHPCRWCRREQKLRKRLEEHKQKLEEQQRAVEADDESEAKSPKARQRKPPKQPPQ